jgi:parvulin-like peptidyl-prolyl isomerase
MTPADRRSARCVAAALALAASLAGAPPAPAEEINRIVLRVNDRIVTLREYETRRAARLRAIEAAADLDAGQKRTLAQEAGRATLRELFEEVLVLSRAQQLRLVAEPGEVDRAVESAQRRFGIPDDAEFAQALVQSGSSIEEFRARMARQLLLNQVAQREVAPKVKVDDEEIARYWREHPEEFTRPERRRVAEAVVRETGPKPPAERRALASRIRDALVAGGSIAEWVAAEGLGDEVLVLDHGWIVRGELEPTLDAAVWELDAGGVAGPLDGRGGLHVVHLLEIEPAAVRPLEDVREAITGKLRDEEFVERSAEMVDQLSRTAFIVENVPPDAVGYRTVEVDEHDPLRALMRDAPPAIEDPVPAESIEPEPPAQSERKNS